MARAPDVPALSEAMKPSCSWDDEFLQTNFVEVAVLQSVFNPKTGKRARFIFKVSGKEGTPYSGKPYIIKLAFEEETRAKRFLKRQNEVLADLASKDEPNVVKILYHSMCEKAISSERKELQLSILMEF